MCLFNCLIFFVLFNQRSFSMYFYAAKIEIISFMETKKVIFLKVFWFWLDLRGMEEVRRMFLIPPAPLLLPLPPQKGEGDTCRTMVLLVWVFKSPLPPFQRGTPAGRKFSDALRVPLLRGLGGFTTHFNPISFHAVVPPNFYPNQAENFWSCQGFPKG